MDHIEQHNNTESELKQLDRLFSTGTAKDLLTIYIENFKKIDSTDDEKVAMAISEYLATEKKRSQKRIEEYQNILELRIIVLKKALFSALKRAEIIVEK